MGSTDKTTAHGKLERRALVLVAIVFPRSSQYGEKQPCMGLSPAGQNLNSKRYLMDLVTYITGEKITEFWNGKNRNCIPWVTLAFYESEVVRNFGVNLFLSAEKRITFWTAILTPQRMTFSQNHPETAWLLWDVRHRLLTLVPDN